MMFEDRVDAGRKLSSRLQGFEHHPDVIVLGIPRGGVVVAFEVAGALHVPLDIFLARKLGVPGNEELAFGAIAGGGRYLDLDAMKASNISTRQIESITAIMREMLVHLTKLYRVNRPPLRVEGRTIILVDDGIATGASVFAAIHCLREMQPASLVLAVPVAPASTWRWLRSQVDDLICLHEPEDFNSVGQFYEEFSQVTDREVLELLRAAGPTSLSDAGG